MVFGRQVTEVRGFILDAVLSFIGDKVLGDGEQQQVKMAQPLLEEKQEQPIEEDLLWEPRHLGIPILGED